MNGSVIVWDLETVPDLRGFAAANDLIGKTDEEVRDAIGDKFPKHIYHSIVCIGALVARTQGDHWAVDALGAPHVGERTEKQLISAFVDRIADLNPQLITFNGNSFDLPVLRYRAMIRSVTAPGLAERSYFNRYTEDALDLCDALSSFNSGARATLNEIARIMGLPGKPDDINGGQVEKYFREGRIKEIAAYCECDVVNTYRVWLRYELFRGRLTESAHQASELNLTDFIKRHESTKQHLRAGGAGPLPQESISMAVVEPKSRGDLIIEIVAEGGSIALYGFRTEHGWLFTRETLDRTPELIDEDQIETSSACVDTSEAALKLLDQYPWVELYPVSIHQEFRHQIWSALQERLRNVDDFGAKLRRWRELCHDPRSLSRP
jgi:predicted PolB exonuclease-like 3'-5' exonuclease